MTALDRTPEDRAATIARELTTHQADVLTTICGGPDRIGGWGAWVSAVMEVLRGKGLAVLVAGRLKPTDLGRAVAAARLTQEGKG